MLSGVPADITVECDAIPDPPMVTATDNCDLNVIVDFSEMRTDGDCPYRYTLTRTWTATDACGNTISDSQTITIDDTTAPMLSAIPNDVTVECDAIPDPPVVTATDNCDLNVVVNFSEMRMDGTCLYEYTLTRTWTATDACGNTVSDSQTITVDDTTAPMLSATPDDVTVECDAIPDPPVITATDNCDLNVMVNFSEMRTDGDCPYRYTLTRTWMATDACGNQAMTQSQVITVDDTTAPVLQNVPIDTTVNCDQVPPADNVTAMDNCDPNVQVVFNEERMDGACPQTYILTRTWMAEDVCGNTSTLAMQTIEVQDTTPPVLQGVPGDTTTICNRIPDPAVVTAMDNCDDNLMVQFNEEMVAGDCIGEFTLTRTWTATDSCGNMASVSQTVTAIDTIAPEFTLCVEDTVRNIQSVGVCSLIQVLRVQTIDNCTFNLPINYTIDFGNDGIIDSVNMLNENGFLVINYPIGTNIVTFTTTDDCGNTNTCQTTVQINDPVPPAFFCNPVTDTLDGIDSMAFVLPEEFLMEPFFECCPDTILFELPDGTFTDTLFFDCDATQFPDGIDVEVRFFDKFGNSASCETKVFIVPPPENPNFCDSEPPPFAYLNGQVYTENQQYVANVEVELDGAMMAATTTAEMSGYYEFFDIPTGYNYTVSPYSNADPLNGVSTWDMVLISRHILGIETLDSPYKQIAADVNNSANISTLDLVELRKLILFIDTAFQYNTSWRFVDANYAFPLSGDPFTSTFPEACAINDLNLGQTAVDFVAVKIGDVNGSATVAGMMGNNSSARSEQPTLLLETPEQTLKVGSLLRVPIRASTATELLGFQFTLGFDPSYLQYVGVEKGALEALDETNFGFSHEDNGQITGTWHQPRAVDLEAETVLFYWTFRVLQPAPLQELLEFNSQLTRAEAYTKGGEILPLALMFTPPELIAEASPQNTFQLLQNQPNPFREETTIGFHFWKESLAELTIFDASGRTVYQQKTPFTTGYHEVVISDLPSQGIFYYQLKTSEQTELRKMVRVR